MIVSESEIEMTSQILDAYGRSVESLGICARCGANIKYIFTFNGQTYGSECIEVVTGIGKDYQVFNGKDLNLEASKAKKTQAELDRTTRLAAYEVRQQAIREVQQANATRFEEVVYLLENTTGDFCASVANQIKRAEYHTELFNILSDRQFEIIAEIYGKALGRKNSKAYDAGVNEFHEKYGEKE